jgi:hypothetical protein
MPASKLSMRGAPTEGERWMSTGLNRQPRRAVADDTTGAHAPGPVPVLRRVELSRVAPPEPAAALAWDPHEVWLSRVKKPRDARTV